MHTQLSRFAVKMSHFPVFDDGKSLDGNDTYRSGRNIGISKFKCRKIFANYMLYSLTFIIFCSHGFGVTKVKMSGICICIHRTALIMDHAQLYDKDKT